MNWIFWVMFGFVAICGGAILKTSGLRERAAREAIKE